MSNPPIVMALGFFDGIHIGHAALMQRAKKVAESIAAKPAVLTFDIHPDTFVRGENVELINSADDRRYILQHWFGIDSVFFIHFNEHTMRMDWKDFIRSIIEKYNAVHFIVGHDFCFGYKGYGTAERLRAFCIENGLGCDIIEPVTRDGQVVSSTLIRALLKQGEMEKANELLGHPYVLTDTVRTGFRIGHSELDAPTINMAFSEGVLIPRYGVYATRVLLPDGEHDAITNIGTRPTFGGERITVETNILDYSADLYGKSANVLFYGFIRPERKFDSAPELMAQIKCDITKAREILAKI